MYSLLSVALDYINGPADTLIDIVTVAFTITGKGGLFSTWVPFNVSWVERLAYAIYLFYVDIIEVYGDTPEPYPGVVPLVPPVGGPAQPL